MGAERLEKQTGHRWSSGSSASAGSSATSANTSAFDAEAGLQAILDNSAAVIFVKDREGRYTVVNDGFLAPLGLVREDVLGRTAAELWPGTDVTREGDERVLRDGAVDTRDQVVDLPDGPHTVMTVRFPLFDSEGRIDSVAAIATDVTERKAVEEALKERNQLLDTILRASPDIVTVVDERGRVKAISDASFTILGYDLSEPVHDEVEALVHRDDLDHVHLAYSRLFSGEDPWLDVRCRVRHRDGRWLTIETRGQVIEADDGTFTGAVVVSRDVTQELEFEEELQRALLMSEQASAAKSMFLSRMSHELRTPLNSVLGFAQLLEMENLPVERAEAVAHILQGGKHLLDLIDEVLDIARIESGHLALSLQPVELVPLLSEALDLSRPMAERMSVDLTLDTHAIAGHERVFADRQRLLQVLLNLLSNAIKYNATGGSVEVSARTPEPDDGRVLIAVADDGPGISPDSIARVFDPFERLGAERSSVEGTGVGLTLSQHLVKEMGGEISVSSELGAGTTFTVALSPHPSTEGGLRADSGRAPGDPAPASAPKLAGGLRVLHAEDNLANLELVEKVLARVGNVDLVSATDGSQALALAREERPDLLLLDLHLPDMSGRQLLDQLRADPLTSEIPVVIVSADAPALFEQPFSDRVVACLTKPIDVRELMRVVERVLSEAGRSR